MKNKGLAIGLVALVALIGIVAFLAKGKPVEPAAQPVETAVKIEQPAAPIAEPAPEPTPAPPTAPEEQPDTEESMGETQAEEPDATVATTEEAPQSESLLAAPAGIDIDAPKAMEDRVLGNADAPVTIIEYASMTCSHCAHFHNTILADVKKELIDTGKAKLIFRDFPLDQFAMKAAMMSRCADHGKYFDLTEVIFKNQERWIKSEDPLKSLEQLGTLAGMDVDYINACVNSAELEHGLLAKVQDAQSKYNIKSTPTFIFNDGAEQFSGAQDVSKFVEIVNKLSAGK